MHVQQPLHLLFELGQSLFYPLNFQECCVRMKFCFRSLQELLQNIFMIIGDDPEGFNIAVVS